MSLAGCTRALRSRAVACRPVSALAKGGPVGVYFAMSSTRGSSFLLCLNCVSVTVVLERVRKACSSGLSLPEPLSAGLSSFGKSFHKQADHRQVHHIFTTAR